MGEVLTSGPVDTGLPFERLDPVIDEIVSYLIVASTTDEAKLDLLDVAVSIFDEVVLPLVRDNLEEAALYHIDYTGLDANELIDCLGGNSVAESLSWAVNTLNGHSEEPPESLGAFMECTGIDPALAGADEKVLASAVFYVFTAAINKMLASLAAELV